MRYRDADKLFTDSRKASDFPYGAILRKHYRLGGTDARLAMGAIGDAIYLVSGYTRRWIPLKRCLCLGRYDVRDLREERQQPTG